ncbi:hypothetical protein AB0F52_39375 [Amycolatopsis sp. NPDC024027]|uniref:tetratricopeptide repeat protein n=1 Tax=Amycolatopsis sp. NPDC024027 TaxID=3154327 RepID=UPI00340E9620
MTGSGAATATNGYANSGVHVGDVNLLTGVPVKTRYRQQVQRIAPHQLLSRETELRELAEFCTSPETAGSYLYLRARAWSGKSALMSWFVMHPPEGVRVVSFFITARLAAQNDRNAFIDNVMEQLLTVLGETLPPFLTESNREAHLLGLLAEAAEACDQRGEHFVLLVDGLDEDRGVHDGPDSHSVAALLPADLPAGMRVVVTGRLNPPIPADVADHHPLRDDKMIRHLRPSAEARAIQVEMDRELKRLLRGSVAEQDLLGLVVAAGGGLSAPDIAELTGWPERRIYEHLHTVTGRSFTALGSHFRPDGPDVFLLGHEDLQVTALTWLGADRVASYRDRVHVWAEQCRSRGWPIGTPEYLLRGYFHMLHESDDWGRMTELAADPLRQDRLLQISGGDAIALTEINKAQVVIATRKNPDIVAMIRLAIHRDFLIERNDDIPPGLPAAWAAVGKVDRAKSLANSIPELSIRAESFALIAHSLSTTGSHRASEFFNQSEAAARSIKEYRDRDPILALVARVAASLGNHQKAEEIARSIGMDRNKALALASVVKEMTRGGEHERARVIARSVADFQYRALVLASQAEVEAALGDLQCARNLLDEAETAARSITGLRLEEEQSQALASVAEAAARVGDRDRAETIANSITESDQRVFALISVAEAHVKADDLRRAHFLLDQAEAIARSSPLLRRWMLACLARTVAETGDLRRAHDLIDEAEAIARSSIDQGGEVRTLMWVARLLAEGGALGLARGFIDQAEAIAYSITDPHGQSVNLARVAGALTYVDDYEHAEAIARSIISIDYRIEALASLAKAACRVGRHAHDLLEQAEATMRSIPDRDHRTRVRSHVAQALAETGQHEQAEAIARSFTSDNDRTEALASIVETMAETKDFERAEAIARSITSSWRDLPAKALASVVRAQADAGDRERAETVARSITDPSFRAKALASVVRALADAGDRERAETVARSITDPSSRAKALASVARALADAGDRERAEALFGQAEAIARSISFVGLERASALTWIAEAVAKSGNCKRAELIAHSIGASGDSSTAALNRVATAIADAGDHEYAEKIASSISDQYWRARTLVSVTRRSSCRSNIHAIVEALKLEHWQYITVELLHLKPNAIAKMKEEFIRAWRLEPATPQLGRH